MQFSSESRERGWGLFPAGWAGEVLQYIIEVWDAMRLPAKAKLEPRITKLLGGAIRKRYEAEGRDWFVTIEDPDWQESGKEISRTDLRFYPPGPKRHAVCFVFESKCLNRPASNASKYVGADGMMCFVTGKYGTGTPCGGMLGYVMDGNLSRAHKAVCKAIRNKRTSLHLSPDTEFQQSPVLPDARFHGETKHNFIGGLFTIYHLFLKVRWKAS